jgi:peroxiredoxin
MKAPIFNNLLGVDGRRYSLSSFDDKQILVTVFVGNRCPTARVYGDRMRSIQMDYAERGVQLVALNSNNAYLYSDESYPRMVEIAEERGYNFPYLKDEDQSVAKDFGALVTLHVFAFDRERRLKYRGRIDDSRDPVRVTSHDLRNALDDLLANREVKIPDTRPFACTIDYI